MAKCRQSIIPFIPGAIAASLVVTVILAAFAALWLFALKQDDGALYFDHYLWRVISFTFIQAALSTAISVILAVPLAKSLDQNQFYGKSWLLRLLSLTFVLPSLIVVGGLLAIYGSHGWLANICGYWGIDYTFSIYGLNGILLAHVFLNFPLATRYCYQSLQLIANEQKQLAQQLGLSYWQTFRYLELPLLIKQLLPLSGLIFMLCFASFATVLTLGGGPKYTTIEVAIYQAVRDFELYQAVVLALIQLLFCVSFMLLLNRLTPKQAPSLAYRIKPYWVKTTLWQKLFSLSYISVCTLFIVTPLLTLIFDGLYYFRWHFISGALIQSLFTSIGVALCSAMLAMALTIALLWTNSQLQLKGNTKLSESLMLLGSLMLAIPSMVLSAGFFILFYHQINVPGLVFMLVVISNSFLALPFILRQLASPLADLTKQYDLLSQSLHITGWRYFYLIDFKALKSLFIYSFAFACIMSMGDFGIIALFGGQAFMTLPYYLYELMAHYRYEEASLTALLLFLISFLLMTLFENTHNDRT